MSQGNPLRRYSCALLVVFILMGTLNIVYFVRFEKTPCTHKTSGATTDITAMGMPIGIIFFSLAFLSMIRIYLIGKYSDYCPLDFKNLGRCDKCIGMLLKCIPGLLNLGHLALLVPVVVLAITRLIDSNCTNMATSSSLQSQFQVQSRVVVIANLCEWVVIHFVTPFIRSFINYPSFLYNPTYNATRCRRIWCKYTGP